MEPLNLLVIFKQKAGLSVGSQITASGNVYAGQQLRAGGSVSVAGSVIAKQGLQVSGSASIGGTLGIATSASIGGTLKIDSTLTVSTGTLLPNIQVTGQGPNIIRFHDAGGFTSVTNALDLVYRATPNTLGFERLHLMEQNMGN